MIMEIYNCIGDEYNTKSFFAKVYKRLLFHPANGTLEIECIFSPEVSGHSLGRFNVMFKDKNEKLDEEDRKYFSKVSWFRKQRLRWMYGRNWFQKTDNVWKVVSFLLGGALGFYVKHLIGC